MGHNYEMFQKWGLKANPFTPVAPELETGIIEKIFVGRTDEIDHLIGLVTQSLHAINVHVTGDYGVGKTTFLRRAVEMLNTRSKIMAVYLTIEGQTTYHFGNSVLRALAEKLDIPFQKTDFPRSEIEQTLRSLVGRFDRMVFFVDQLEYHDPAVVVRLLVECRPILDLPCSFVITGHPYGPTGSMYTSASGIFADRIELPLFNADELMEMTLRNLNLVRSAPKSIYDPFEEAAVRLIAEQGSRGLPRLMNLDCHLILDESAHEQINRISPDDVNRLYAQLGGRRLQSLPYDTLLYIEAVAQQGIVSEHNPDQFLTKVSKSTFSDVIKTMDRLTIEEVLVKRQGPNGDMWSLPRPLELGFQKLQRDLPLPKIVTRELWLDYDHRRQVLSAESHTHDGRMIHSTSAESCAIDMDGLFEMMQVIPLSLGWDKALRFIGQSVFENLIQKPAPISAQFHEALGATEEEGQVSLVLITSAEGLRMPFEIALFHDFLCLDYPVRRYIKNRNCRKPLRLLTQEDTESIRVLLVGANTGYLVTADDEIDAVERILTTGATGKYHLDITKLHSAEATYDRVTQELARGYHLFHYSGHGYFDLEQPENSYLQLRSSSEQKEVQKLTASDLKDLVSTSQLRFAYLSCCEGTATGTGPHNSFLGIADALVRGKVPEVIGYRWPVVDVSAMALAKKFYEEFLANGLSSSNALWKARRALARGPEKRQDSAWASPILIQQH